MQGYRIITALIISFQVCCLGWLDLSRVHAEESRYALVTKGAFLLSEKPNLRQDGRFVYSKIGYLPTGTIVYLDNKQIIKKGRKRETYYFVRSEVGLNGHLREGLFTRFKENRVLVPIGYNQYEFWLKKDAVKEVSEDDECSKTPPECNFFTRDDNVHIELLGDPSGGVYKAKLHHHKPERKQAYGGAINGYMHQSLVDDEFEVKVIDTQQQPVMPVWEKEDISQDQEMMRQLMNRIEAKLPDQSTLKRMLSADGIECIVSSNADAELAFKLFNSGFGIKFDAQLKSRNTKYITEKYTLREDQKTPEVYTVLRRVRCLNMEPQRMEQLVLQESVDFSGYKRENIYLSDIQSQINSAKSPWLRSLESGVKSKRMVEIRRWEDYHTVYQMFERLAKSNSAYLSGLPLAKQKLLLNFLVQQIAYYAHPEEKYIPVATK